MKPTGFGDLKIQQNVKKQKKTFNNVLNVLNVLRCGEQYSRMYKGQKRMPKV